MWCFTHPHLVIHWQHFKLTNRIYQLHIRPDGAVAEIKILRTTGNGLLDNRALATLRTWRFRPGAVTVVDIPVAFIRTANFYVVLIH